MCVGNHHHTGSDESDQISGSTGDMRFETRVTPICFVVSSFQEGLSFSFIILCPVDGIVGFLAAITVGRACVCVLLISRKR